jgi:hypothetical protein
MYCCLRIENLNFSCYFGLVSEANFTILAFLFFYDAQLVGVGNLVFVFYILEFHSLI